MVMTRRSYRHDLESFYVFLDICINCDRPKSKPDPLVDWYVGRCKTIADVKSGQMVKKRFESSLVRDIKAPRNLRLLCSFSLHFIIRASRLTITMMLILMAVQTTGHQPLYVYNPCNIENDGDRIQVNISVNRLRRFA